MTMLLLGIRCNECCCYCGALVHLVKGEIGRLSVDLLSQTVFMESLALVSAEKMYIATGIFRIHLLRPTPISQVEASGPAKEMSCLKLRIQSTQGYS
jgi:hypothetical protein